MLAAQTQGGSRPGGWLLGAEFLGCVAFRFGSLEFAAQRGVAPWLHGQLQGLVQSAGQGQPSWLHWFYSATNSIFTSDPHAWAYGIATLESLIALALITGFARKTTYIVTICTGLGIWAVAEGFGGPYNSTSTDVGTACIYALVALALLVLSLQAGPSRYSLDYYLEQRIPWWHKVAEVGARNHPASGEQKQRKPSDHGSQPAPAAP